MTHDEAAGESVAGWSPVTGEATVSVAVTTLSSGFSSTAEAGTIRFVVGGSSVRSTFGTSELGKDTATDSVQAAAGAT